MATMTETLPNYVHVFRIISNPVKLVTSLTVAVFPHLVNFPDLPLPGRDEWNVFEHRGNQLKSAEDRYSAKAAFFANLNKWPAVVELLHDLKIIACRSAIPPSSG